MSDKINRVFTSLVEARAALGQARKVIVTSSNSLDSFDAGNAEFFGTLADAEEQIVKITAQVEALVYRIAKADTKELFQ